MKTNDGIERIGERHVERGIASLGRGLRHEKVIGIYLAGCVALTAIAAVLLVTSCGGNHSQSSSLAARSSEPVETEPVAVSAVATQPAASAMTASTASMAPASDDSASHDSQNAGLPPEIALGEFPTVVAPGEPVAITVYGTPDVTEMSLWDGLNDRQAMVHDSNGDVWRVDYRVPLRPKAERIGLSVTARNDQGRWRRLWIFMQVASTAEADGAVEAPAQVAVVDSTNTN